MKKLLSLVIAAVFVLAMCIPFVSLADNGASFVIDDVSGVNPGDEFTAVLKVSGDYELHTANFSVSYDPSALSIVSVEKGKFINDMVLNGSCVFYEDHEAVPGNIKGGILMPINGLSGEGEILRMTFRINDGVTINQQLVIVISELGYMPVGQTVSTPVAYTTDNCIITISGANAPDGGYNPGETGTGEYRPHTIVTVAPDGGSETSAPNSGKVTTPDPDSDVRETNSPVGGDSDAAATKLPQATPAPAQSGSIPPTVLIIILCALAIVVIAIIIFIVVSSKKKKPGHDGAPGNDVKDESDK